MYFGHTVARKRREAFGARVRELRGERSQEHAARMINIRLLELSGQTRGRSWLQRIEDASRALVTPEEVEALAMGLTSTPEEADAAFRELRGLMGWGL